MITRFLGSQDVVAYRDLRLEALKEAPTAFGSSYEQEAAFTMDQFAARLHLNNDFGNGVLGAFDEEQRLIGIVGFLRENRPKRAHIGSIVGMYVAVEFRGKGVGSKLLSEVLSHARQLDGLRQIILTVTATNKAACALYQAHGFERFGLERNALFVDGCYFDEEHLMLCLSEE